MTIDLIAAAIIGLCLLIGSVFILIGAFGMLKLNSTLARMHAPTTASTLGIGTLLLASMIHSAVFGEVSFQQLLIMGFLFVTAPISAHFIAKVHIHRNTCKSPPKPARDDTWSTLDTPDDEAK